MTKSIGNNLGFPPEIVRFVGKKWVVPIFKEFDSTTQIRFGDLKQKNGLVFLLLQSPMARSFLVVVMAISTLWMQKLVRKFGDSRLEGSFLLL